MNPLMFLSRQIPAVLSAGLTGNLQISVWIILCSILNEVGTQMSEDMLKSRLNKLEEAIKLESKRRELELSDLICKLETLDEHKYWVIRNGIRHSLRDALPETVESYNKSLVNLILNEEYDYEELSCEIISQLNAQDIFALGLIKLFIDKGENTAYLEYKKRYEEDRDKPRAEQTKGKLRTDYRDRNILISNQTIIWQDFSKFIRINTSLTSLVCHIVEVNSSNGTKFVEINEYNYIANSFFKIERLGIITCDIEATLGVIGNSYINRFHLTILGSKVLKYIDISEKSFFDIIDEKTNNMQENN